MADTGLLANVAATLADGAPVDWDHAEAAAAGREKRLLSNLRLVAGVAHLYASIPPAQDEPATAPAVEPQGPRWGRLVVLEKIGEGISSDVHRAWDLELHRDVALKLLRDESPSPDLLQGAHERVVAEARRMARVRHPHVVAVYGADRANRQLGLWMELVRGESLEQIVKERGPFGAREATIVGLDLCAALAAVHGAGLLHRDVKAQNVMRESGGRTVLMDFGTGEELQSAGARHRLVGTPLYLAPEIFEGRAASVQSDLYALGVLLFYLVTGQFPVAAATLEDLGRAHRKGAVKRLRDVRADLPDAFIRVVEQAIARDPADRYTSAGAMEAALRSALDAPSPVAAPAPTPARTRVWSRPSALAAIAALCVVGIALAGIVWSRRPAVPPTGVTRLAVLPLVDDSGGAAPPYLADALTDQLIATLGGLEAVRVTSRASVMQFKGSTTPLPEIARTLGVDAVLESSLTMLEGADGGRVRVNARLIQAGTDTQLWARTFERAAGDLLELQSTIARQIAEGLSLGASATGRLGPQRATDPAAERAYFQGRFHLGQYGVEHARLALDAFNRAVQMDASHAPAHAGAARAYVSLGFSGALPQPEARARALAEAETALGLDAALSDAHLALADLRFYYDWNWRDAEAAYRRAVELDGSSALARTQYARYLAAAGRLDDAVAQGREAVAIDPLSPEAAQTLGLMHYFRRDYDAAVEAVQRGLSLDPRFARGHYVLGRIHDARNEPELALQETERALAMAAEPGTSWRAQAIRLQARAGRRTEARQQFDALRRDVRGRNLRLSDEFNALVLLALGDTEEALAAMERAAGDRDPSLLWLAVDPRVDSLRGHPRFEALVARLGRPR